MIKPNTLSNVNDPDRSNILYTRIGPRNDRDRAARPIRSGRISIGMLIMLTIAPSTLSNAKDPERPNSLWLRNFLRFGWPTFRGRTATDVACVRLSALTVCGSPRIPRSHNRAARGMSLQIAAVVRCLFFFVLCVCVCVLCR